LGSAYLLRIGKTDKSREERDFLQVPGPTSQCWGSAELERPGLLNRDETITSKNRAWREGELVKIEKGRGCPREESYSFQGKRGKFGGLSLFSS